MVLAAILLFRLFRFDWIGQSFWIEHSLKATTFFFLMVCAFNFYAATWRLAGFSSMSYMKNPLKACSPAAFWAQCNRPAQRWFYQDIFKPLAGLKHPVRALLLTFAVSGVMHEYIITVALGRVTGYTFIFFMIQAVTVALARSVRLQGPVRFVGILATYVFLIISAVLFFHPINQAFPFYSMK